jgi:xylulokinase
VAGFVEYTLGIDLGTSGCKVLALDVGGRLLATAEARYPMVVPRPGWAEQHPRSWWRAAAQGVRSLLARLPPGATAIGVGVTGQMHSLVALDSRRRVIRPAILWCDQRSERQAELLAELVGETTLSEITLNPSRGAFTGSKLLWLREHEPDAYAQLRHAMLPKDWLVGQLTGRIVTEPSDASGTGLFDVAATSWSALILDRLDIDPAIFAAPEPSFSVVGYVLPEVAPVLGLPAGIPVVAGGGDQAAAAYAAGATGPGVIACDLGTSAAVLASQPGPVPGCLSHVLADQWLYLTSTHAGTLCLDWWSRVAGRGRARPAEVLRAAAASVPGARGVRFTPLLMGERDPVRGRPPLTGSLRGLRAEHTGADLARAVIEGIAFEIRRIARPVPSGGAPQQWRVLGGGAKATLLVQTLADVLHQPLHVLPDASSAGGAAQLAWRGLGVRVPPPRAGEGEFRPSDDIDYDYDTDFDAYCAGWSG